MDEFVYPMFDSRKNKMAANGWMDEGNSFPYYGYELFMEMYQL